MATTAKTPTAGALKLGGWKTRAVEEIPGAAGLVAAASGATGMLGWVFGAGLLAALGWLSLMLSGGGYGGGIEIAVAASSCVLLLGARTWRTASALAARRGAERVEGDCLRLVAMLEAAPDFVGLAAAGDSRVSYVNPAGRRMCGVGADEDVTALRIWDFHPPWANKLLEEEALPVAASAGIWTGECAFLHRDGSEVPVSMVLLGHRSCAGRVEYFSTISRDITEQKRVQVVREAERCRFREMAEALPQLVWTAETDGACDYVSRRCVEYTGIAAEEQLGAGWLRLIHPDDQVSATAAWEGALASGTMLDNEVRVRGADGVYRWFKVRAVPQRDSLGNVVKWLGSNTDIDDLKKFEQHVREMNAGLEQRVEERTAALEAANKELESFAYSVSHDLRAPLRAAGGFTDLALAEYGDKLGEEGKRLLNVVAEEVDRMGRLIDGLLRLSQLGREELKFSVLDMTKVARGAFDSVRMSGGAAVTFDLDGLPAVRGDEALLRQVWVNLIGNAVKYTGTRTAPVIHVGGSRANGWNMYYVKDNGVGFDMRYVHKLFGVFQRLHGRGEFAGTGIGLALVRRIVHRHGGEVWAEGEVGEGSTFYFTLPDGTARDEAAEEVSDDDRA